MTFLQFGTLFFDGRLKLLKCLNHLHERVLCGLGFFSTFLSSVEIGFLWSVFLILTTISHVVRSIHTPMLLAEVPMLLGASFLGDSGHRLINRSLFPFLPFLKAFLLDCALDFSCVHTRSMAWREIRSKRMSTGVISFLWRLKWSCHISGHIKRTWLSRLASVNDTFAGMILGLAM